MLLGKYGGNAGFTSNQDKDSDLSHVEKYLKRMGSPSPRVIWCKEGNLNG